MLPNHLLLGGDGGELPPVTVIVAAEVKITTEKRFTTTLKLSIHASIEIRKSEEKDVVHRPVERTRARKSFIYAA